jgi:UDP-N-acetyl-2-amino-2-deoxyglucuronate dehydrogenase
MSSLRFAIIGCGKIAPRHAAEAAKQGKLVAVCDIVKDRADALAQQYDAKAYYTIEALLDNEKAIDIAAICTPNGLHAQHSITALKAGCHILCEKPLSISGADAVKMIDTAKAANRKLFVVKSTRYNPALATLKKIIEEKKLGQLYSFQLNCFWNRPASYYHDSWKGQLAMDGGTLYTQFSHYIDALLWLFGDVDMITGFRQNTAHKDTIEFEDNGVVAIRMQNGMLGGLNWSLNTFRKNMEVSLSLIAEKGSIRIGGEYMNKVEYQLMEDAQLSVPDTGSANDYGFYKGSMSNHDKVYENLLIALENDNHPFTHAADGLKTVETIEKIYKAVSLPGNQF